MHSLNLAFLLLLSLALDQAVELSRSSPRPDSPQIQKSEKTGAANIIFKSTDGGQTWQDISDGLPVDVQADGLVENENELYLRAGNGIYHRNPTAPFWKKEILPNGQSNMAPGKTGIVAYNYQQGQFLQKVNGTGLWLPLYPNLQQKQVRTVFETIQGTAFIGSDQGLFKSTDSGKTWKQVYTGGWVIKMIESNGLLLATSQEGIIRLTDEGENWELVINEGGVGIAIEPIKGGFAAITCNTESETRRVRTSYDGGKTWQPIDAGLPESLLIASIVEVGESLFCGHPDGIFRSSDKGKTWELLLPSPENKVFNLYVSGNVMYAIPRAGGC
ncbi:MAG: exo-alpha-sialidase [Bacteroidetes bacterium]|nr:exo-alpha-sialidase [Bacteroidota bacterium]